MFQGRLLLGAAFVLCGLLAAPVTGADEVTGSRIAEVWAEREKRVSAYRVVWSEVATYPKGSSYIAPRADPKDAPTTDVSIPAKCSLLIAGNKSRYEYRGQMWSTESRKLEPAESVVVFDGTKYGRTSLKSTLINNPQVTIKNASASPQNNLPVFLPIWLTARASSATGLSIDKFTATGRKEIVGGRLCYEYLRDISVTSQERLFLDPIRDYQVTRESYYNQGKPIIKLDINYQPNSVLGWVPANWDCVLSDRNGAIEQSTHCTVTAFDTNVITSASDFDPLFPTGARVIDLTSGKEMHSGILPNGERSGELEYKPGKHEPTYQDLMKQPPQSQMWERYWSWWFLGIGLLLVVGAVVWRKRSQNVPHS